MSREAYRLQDRERNPLYTGTCIAHGVQPGGDISTEHLLGLATLWGAQTHVRLFT